MNNSYKAGFVSILGKPNVGKSTLVNRYLREKISIVSPKPQTTRNRVMAILTTEDYQVIFIDTPGIHKPKHKLGEYMVKEAERGMKDSDIILVMLDATTRITDEDYKILNSVSNVESNKILSINKIDTVDKNVLLPIINKAKEICEFDEYIPVSALTGENVDVLLNCIVNMLPKSPPYYPDDQLTDKTERFHIAEIIREKVLSNTREEIPHSIAIIIEEFRENIEKDKIFIRAVIYVERKSQKKIIIGNKGRMIKKIGTEARIDIEKFLGRRVFLELWVKVYEKWRKNDYALKLFGYK